MREMIWRKMAVVAFTLAIQIFALCLNVDCSERDFQQQSTDEQSIVILISFDGMRWDYPEITDTPNFDFVIKSGVRAQALIPCFPIKTFPNHYTIVTGLYPENHGIVANNMYDSEMDAKFKISDRMAVQDPRWWGGEPIWVTAEKAGLTTAAFFWLGTEAKIQGRQPTYWYPYDGRIPNEARIDQLLNWLDLPKPHRPALLMAYFSVLDDVGHDYGPNSPEIAQAIAYVDSLLGRLLQGLEARALLNKVNLILVSDHGMAEVSPERAIFLEDYIDLATVQVIDWSPVLALNPKPGMLETVYNRLLHAHPHLQVYRKETIPARLHYRNHPRIPALIGVADEGWTITTHQALRNKPSKLKGGDHGYDKSLPSMGGIFIARGPAFRSNLKVDAIENIHIYNLLAHILDIEPAPNDGRLQAFQMILKK
ncbi:MAG: ectonucleotide pyrophosphatase/phosphodiesterase [bacterium]